MKNVLEYITTSVGLTKMSRVFIPSLVYI